MLQVLGLLAVAAPGTPVRATTNITVDAQGVNNAAGQFKCHAVLFQARPANTGKVYIGLSGLDKASLVGVSGVLAIPTANSIPSYSISLTLAPAGIELSDLFLDADNAGDGALITVLVT